MLKLPDAIIAATAIKNEAVLITADNDFKRVKRRGKGKRRSRFLVHSDY